MDYYNSCTCSYKVMQKILNCSQATIARNIKVLKDLNLITVRKNGNINRYIINHRVKILRP